MRKDANRLTMPFGDGLLDTNGAIDLIKDDVTIASRMADYDQVFVPAIVIGELEYGAWYSARVEANLARVDTFVAGVSVLSCGLGTARHYGRVKNELRRKGRPIPDNDLWIAAVALEYNLTLITRDSHFRNIEGLVLDFLPTPNP